MEVAARVDLGVIDEARHRHRRRRGAVIVLAIAVLAGGTGFEVARHGSLFWGASVGAIHRPSQSAPRARASLGRCGGPGGPPGRQHAGPRFVEPLCLLHRTRPAGILPQQIVIGPAASIANAPVHSR